MFNNETRCPNCGNPNPKIIQAGVSKKTGKSYNAFGKCDSCGKTFNLNSYNAPGNAQPRKDIPVPPDAILGRLDTIITLLQTLVDMYQPPPTF